jgi:DNA (cytosine-5)-methyltransferase 1
VRKQTGNAVPVNLVKAVILKLLPYVAKTMDMTPVIAEYELDLRYGTR